MQIGLIYLQIVCKANQSTSGEYGIVAKARNKFIRLSKYFGKKELGHHDTTQIETDTIRVAEDGIQELTKSDDGLSIVPLFLGGFYS